MKMTRLAAIALCIMLISALCACDAAPSEPARAGYSGTAEGYEYYHAEERDMAWEEDILFLAETYLSKHPKLTEDDVAIITYQGSFNENVEYSNSLYEAEVRQHFIDQIDLLIPRISELNDTEILFETQKIVASLSDYHSYIAITFDKCLPIWFEAIYEENGYSYYARKVPADKEQLLYSRLVAINGTPVEEVVQSLTPYISREYDGWVPAYAAYGQYLTGMEPLQAIGILGENENQVTLTLETAGEATECTLDMVPLDERKEMAFIDGSLSSQDLPLYRFTNQQYYWYEIIDDETLYVRLETLMDDPNYSMDSFFIEAGVILRDAETPMKLIIDFRDGQGGGLWCLNRFASAINRYETNGVYILINGNAASASVTAPLLMAQSIPGAVLVGSPTAQSANFLSYDSMIFDSMPNSGWVFRVSNRCTQAAPGSTDETLVPDILIHQTLEDYKNGIDTVLEYVLAARNALEGGIYNIE